MKLQGIYGELKSVKAEDLKPGMVTIWNYGYKYLVKSVSFSKTGKSLIAVLTSEEGKDYSRKLMAQRLVAVE